VITPIRDRKRTIPLCIEWLLSQEDVEFEWIVVDDGKEPSIMAKNVATKYIRAEPSSCAMTYPENLEKAIPEVSGDYFTVVEDDDWMGPRYLKSLVDGAQVSPVSACWGFPIYHVCGRYFPPRGTSTRVVKSPFPFHPRDFTPHFMCPTDLGLSFFERGVKKAISGRNRLTKTRKAARPTLVFWESIFSEVGQITLVNDGHFLSIKGMPGLSITAIHHSQKKIDSLPMVDDKERSFLKGFVGDQSARKIIGAAFGH
jgi:hypothetical protein